MKEEWLIAKDDYDALIARLAESEVLLQEADEVIEILHGDMDNPTVKSLLAAIEKHWQTYGEPVK